MKKIDETNPSNYTNPNLGYFISADGLTVTFTGPQSVKNYLASGNSLSGKIIILGSNPNAKNRNDNTYTLDDLLPNGQRFNSPSSIIIGNGAILTDSWTSNSHPNPATYLPNIAEIGLQSGAILRAGNPLPFGNFGHSGFLSGTFIVLAGLAYIEGIYNPSNKNNSINMLNIINADKLIGRDSTGNYSPQNSAIQFRAVDSNGNLLSLNDLNNSKIQLSIKPILNNGYQSIQSYNFNFPSFSFDSSIFPNYTDPQIDRSTQLLDTFLNFNNNDYQCFLMGSEIETLYGWEKVENIAIGDMIATYVNGNKEFKPVTWILSASLSYQNKKVIQIKKDAFADQSPSKDLFITPEHCLYINGCFIPARMLVNHRNICEVIPQKECDTIYHIELDKHAIINAQNVMTESFLNTGNNYSLIDDDQTLSRSKTWKNDAAAPLNTDRDFVEPIYKNIEQRAIALKIKKVINDPEIIQDPEIYFTNNDGEKINFHQDKNHIFVHIPPETDQICIHSNVSKPSETIGPFVDDRRDLGVLVGKIIQLDDKNYKKINVLTNQQGWYESSPDYNWTSGHSNIPIDRKPYQSILLIELAQNNYKYIRHHA